MFRAMFSPIIKSTWLYLQYLVVFTQVAAGWSAGSNLGEYYQNLYNCILLVTFINIITHHIGGPEPVNVKHIAHCSLEIPPILIF